MRLSIDYRIKKFRQYNYMHITAGIIIETSWERAQNQ